MTEEDGRSLNNKLVLLGIPHDENSSFKRGASEAPPLIRAALHSGSANLTSETGISLARNPQFVDLGDLVFETDGTGAFAAIESHLGKILATGATPLILGGDHAITYPVVRAISRQHTKISLLHFDAHPDLYDELDGNRLSHACPFARIMEEGLVRRLVQVGIRTLNAHQRRQAERFGVEVHEMRSFDPTSFKPHFEEPIYVSFDLDVLDPAFAPGVSHFEPGGLSTREALSILHRVNSQVIGADIVEYNPRHDTHNITAMVGAKLLKEIGAIILRE